MMVIRDKTGVTWLELLMVVAMLAILLAIAYPSYLRYKIKTNRIAAETEMLRIAHQLQGVHLIENGVHNAKLDNASTVSVYPSTGTAFYTLDVYLTADKLDHPQALWQLNATPIDRSIQQGDGVIKLNDLGHRCWRRSSIACTLSNSSRWDGR